MSHTTNKKTKNKQKASTEHVKSGYVTHNRKAKTKTQESQQNMLNQLMSHKTIKQKKQNYKRASTEHAKSAYAT